MVLQIQGNVEFNSIPVVITPTLIEAITTAGLTANLQLALDAGDSNSYSGSGQKWLDTSGNGYDFFLGDDGDADTDDPTFNGSSGGLSDAEYWSSDGGDFFRYDSANETWMNNTHKNNAAFTIFIAAYLTTGSTTFFGTNNGGSGVGLQWNQSGTDKNRLVVANGSGTSMDSGFADDITPLNTWVMQAVVVDEAAGAGGGFLWRDGAFNQISSSDTFNATYTSPSAAAAQHTMAIAANGIGTNGFLQSGSRLAMFAAFDSALTKTNLDDLFTLVRGRLGI